MTAERDRWRAYIGARYADLHALDQIAAELELAGAGLARRLRLRWRRCGLRLRHRILRVLLTPKET